MPFFRITRVYALFRIRIVNAASRVARLDSPQVVV